MKSDSAHAKNEPGVVMEVLLEFRGKRRENGWSIWFLGSKEKELTQGVRNIPDERIHELYRKTFPEKPALQILARARDYCFISMPVHTAAKERKSFLALIRAEIGPQNS